MPKKKNTKKKPKYSLKRAKKRIVSKKKYKDFAKILSLILRPFSRKNFFKISEKKKITF